MAVDTEALADLYSGLAEVLAPSSEGAIPRWFLLEGEKWPLFKVACRQFEVQNSSPALSRAIERITETQGASREDRWQEYEDLFYGSEGPSVWLYESYYIDGRLAGPSTFALKKIYAQAGLEFDGSELSDHASGELFFLAFMVTRQMENAETQQLWKSARKLFVQNHASRWLPDVGRQLIRSAFPAWQAIGHLLVAFLEPPEKVPKSTTPGIVPTIINTLACSLCGFCTQVCPTHALRIAEDSTSTSLQLFVDLCVHCNKCQVICPERTIAMVASKPGVSETMLRTSSRVTCPKCGEPHVSEAELQSVTNKIGYSDHLSYCLTCKGM